MSEWSNVHAWKACIGKPIGGSNPLLSANQKRNTGYRPACAFLFATRRVLANKVTSAQYFRYGSDASATESSFCGFELAERRKGFASLVRATLPTPLDGLALRSVTDQYSLLYLNNVKSTEIFRAF